MKIERGSMWKKWDFHVHTPYSLLNNEFGFNPDAPFEGEDPFDSYVVKLFTKAVNSNISAIGITDYFSIEGYRRIRSEYLCNNRKMTALFPDEDLRRKVKGILIFPNIELRLNTFVGRDAHAVNYHVIFSDTVADHDIEQNFLNQLQLVYKPGSTLPLTQDNIRRIGKEYKENNGGKGDDYAVGLEQAVVSYDNVLQVLKNAIFQDKYLITIPIDEDLSNIDWSGRDASTRKVLYQQCDCLLTSNAKTRAWALAKGREEEQKREFSTIKPCIWGSDAHNYEKMFEPDGQRYCWVKAELTFEGLQQILFEPDDRVKIQKECPDDKDPHQVIDNIQFFDNRFQEEPVYLSEGLTCIIGGKSTGKSMLLRHIATAVANKHVMAQESSMDSTYNPLQVATEVKWKDGGGGERKIIYIPQSWLNRVVDEKEGDSALNKLLSDILLQQDDVIEANRKLKKAISEETDTIKHQILDYVTARKTAEDHEKRLMEEGRSEAFNATIDALTTQREELSALAGITPDKLQRYAQLEQLISEKREILKSLSAEEASLEFCDAPFVFIQGVTQLDNDGHPVYTLDKLPSVKDSLSVVIGKINEALAEMWIPPYHNAQDVISAKICNVSDEKEKLEEEYTPLKQSIAINDQLIKIDEQLANEKSRFAKAKELEEQKKENIDKAEQLKTQILASRENIRNAYVMFCESINAINRADTQLQFCAETDIDKNSLYDAITSLFSSRGFRAFKDKYGYSLSDVDDFTVDDDLFAHIWNAIGASSTVGGLTLKGGNSVQTALERLFSDWYHVHYSVKSGDDTINQMSPGKKALVLLELIINIEKGACPILIDQPEDDLDNRSIYSDLVQYLKQKKHERQIIVVTHNANVVIGADAEEVIIANQEGRETGNRSRRFEYRCGAIENTTPVTDENGNVLNGILNQKGIQEQICDILEGGKKAFELRRHKYFST